MRISRFMLAATFALGSVFGVSAAAHAAESDCLASRVCLFNDGSFTGGIKMLSASSTYISDFNDMMASWKNSFSTKDARWYYEINYGNVGHCMNSTSKNSYVGWTDSDELSSLKIYTTNTEC